ncbi:hypothetical protein PVAND_002722 [Polypedilum vanderplanki]|uniref:UDP-glucuronosyltransferase n=1 Tax=Polypedilum vanderplanki TaxID=319348 RepID=A0A9J6BS07_POLVA|nr:hypothetical protein PVAND_002722 [Polypedilum vanderplanki]
MKFLNFFLFTFLSILINIDGLKILMILPHTKSHWFIGHAIVKSLVDVGHEAIVFSTYKLENPIKGYREIDISSILSKEEMQEESNVFSLQKKGNELSEAVLSHENIQELMKSEEKFDVCFLENFYTQVLLGIFDHLDCVYVSFTSTSNTYLTDIITSNLSPPSYLPALHLPYSRRMNFFQRWINTFHYMLHSLIYHVIHIPQQRVIFNNYFPNAKRSFDEIIKSSSITFVNSHFSITGARPLLPNIIEIAGIHIDRTRQIPKELKKILDFADKGVVVVSLGRNFTSFVTEKHEAFVKALGNLKQNVILKYENETLLNKPNNVVISKWLPQRDILAHHNTRLLITHEGILGITEALSEGVPILIIPTNGNQISNAAHIIEEKCGLALDLKNLNENSLSEAINELIINSTYKNNAEMISQQFQDRTMKPNQAVIYWTEFVARNKGADHLQSAGKNLNFIQYFSIDFRLDTQAVMRYLILFLIGFFSYFCCVNGLKILALLPMGSKSHWAVGHSIIKPLVDAGHEAIVLTPYTLKTPIKNYHEIDISDVLKQFEQDPNFNAFIIRKMPKITQFTFLHSMGNKLVDAVMNNTNVKEFMKRKEKFDICFLETFHTNALSGIFDHFDCIYVPFTSGAIVQWADVMTSNQSPSSYVVTPLLPYAGKLTFIERFWNAFYLLIENISYYFYHLPSQRALYNKYFPNAKRTFDEMIKGAGLMFLSNHVSISGPRPYLTNMIEIGGIHIPPQKELPKHLKEFMDTANDGVILFSMGSVVKAIDWPIEIREALVKSFAKLKQKVIWKYENETLPNKPDNVMISPWIPQRDILAHPNVKMFISHGGFLGTSEATSEGVPILGIPMYGDQSLNIAIFEKTGRGLKLDVDDMNEETITKLINEILTNPKYKQNAEEVKKRFHDRPMTPQEAVVYWTEFVARHNGAKFMRSVGNDYKMIEFFQIDVYITIALLFLSILFVIYSVLKMILRKIFSKKSSKKQKMN